MEMIKAVKLQNDKTIADLVLGSVYLGKSNQNGTIRLNKNISVTVKKAVQDNEIVAVKVIKINLPGHVEGSVIDEEYEIIEGLPKIGDLTTSDIGSTKEIGVAIESIYQTSGPTLFELTDGSGYITAKSFAGPGVRAFPEILIGDTVKAQVRIIERDSELEAEIMWIKKGSEDLKKQIELEFDKTAEPDNKDFMIQSQILEKLKPHFINAAKIIRKAVVARRPILIRHHADCDGYCGGVALEKAIAPLILEQHSDEASAWRYLRRAPSRAPFYDLEDATKDIAMSLQDKSRHDHKDPLIILIDNGSTTEDIAGIQKVRAFEAQVLVVDHHFTEVANGKSCVDDIIHGHINPYLVGGTMILTAGVLGAELARFVNSKVKEMYVIAAMAIIGDRSDAEEYSQYLELCDKAGISEERLIAVAKIIDFEAQSLRFMEAREYVSSLFDLDNVKHIELVSKEVERIKDEILPVLEHFTQVQDHGAYYAATLDIDTVSSRDSGIAAGKLTGMSHDRLKGKKPLVTLGIGPHFITIRAAGIELFNVNTIVSELQGAIPYGGIMGGGHEHAGTIRFVPGVKSQILDHIKLYIKNLMER